MRRFAIFHLPFTIKYALRSLAASPAFTLGSILCLSVGLGVTIAVFSLINALVFRSMPGIRDQAGLRNIWTGKEIVVGPAKPGQVIVGNAPTANVIVACGVDAYDAYRAGLEGIADVLAYTSQAVALEYDGTSHAIRAVYVSPNYFTVLGTHPARGVIPPSNDPDAALVSDGFWRTRMGGRPDVIGQIVIVNHRAFRIAGVAPPKFAGAVRGEFEDEGSRVASIWLPLDATPRATLGEEVGVTLVARLGARTTERELEERATATARGLAAADPVKYRGAFVRIRPLHRGPYEDPSETAGAIAVAMAIPFGLLLIGCANVANLLLARGTARAREIAVRLALGASRRRIIGELLLESILVAISAAAVALVLCALAIRFLEHLVPLPVAIDWRVALFGLGIALATAVGFGLLPAVSASRATMTSRMLDARRVRPLTRRVLVATQLAMSAALLVVSALLIRTVVNVTHVRATSDETRVAALSFDVGLAHYDRARGEGYARDLLERAAAMPGVEAAGMSSGAPFRPRELLFATEPGTATRKPAPAAAVTDGWLAAAGLRVLAGRDFTPQERRGIPTTILVNETLASRFWPSQSPLGRTLVVFDPYAERSPRYDVHVVGVVDSGIDLRIDREPVPRAYVPAPISFVGAQTLWVRTRGDASHVLNALRSAASATASEVPITRLETAADARVRETGPFRWLAQGITAAGGLSLGLASLGLFALLTYLVAQRRREVGVRMALGARPTDIVRLIVGESAWVALAGAVAGSALGVGVAMAMRSEMSAIAAPDITSLLVAGGVLVAAALAASAHPALRAARTDPASVLRAE